MNKKRKIITVICILVVLCAILAGGAAAGYYYYMHRDIIDNEYMQLKDYRHLTLKKQKKEQVLPKEVKAEVNSRLQDKKICKKITDHVIKQGDIVNISCKGYVKDKKKPVYKRKNYDLEVGSGNFVSDIEKQLIGKEPKGTLELVYKFADDYTDKKLAGNEVTFKIKLYYIKENYTKDTLTDEVVKENLSYNTVAEFLDSIQKELEAEKEREYQKANREYLWNVVMKQTKVKKYNDKYLKEEEARFESNYEKQAESLSVPLEKFLTGYCGYTMEEYQKLKTTEAKKKAKKRMIVDAVAEREKLEGKTYKEKCSQVEILLMESAQYE